jgi:hypothetical protein
MVEVLLKRIPTFAAARALDDSYLSHDDDGAYLVFGDFGRFLTGLILRESNTEESARVLREAFKLVGEMATSPDDEVTNTIVVGVLESLADSPECVATARRMLSGRALALFERTAKGWM